MKPRISGLLASAVFAIAGLIGSGQGLAQNAYITNNLSNTVSVIDTATNTVTGSLTEVGTNPYGVAVTPDGSKVYVANIGSNSVSVIFTATNTVLGSPIAVFFNPAGVAATPDGRKVYVTQNASNTYR